MALSLKEGVLFQGIHSRIIHTLPIIDLVYSRFDRLGVITSARDGKHKLGSLHYIGRALDWRTRDFTLLQQEDFHREVQIALGSDYDVVLEKDHLHVEYDPK